MAITFPPDCTTAGDRTEYLYRLQEKLRLEHNANGQAVRDGEITEADWQAYLADTFAPRSERIVAALLRQRKSMTGRDGGYTPRWEPSVTDAD